MAGKKPRASRRTGKPIGRRPADAVKVALGLQHLDAGDPELAVKASGISLPTLYRHRTKRDVAAGVAPTSPTPSLAPAPIAPPVGSQAAASTITLPQGGAVSTRPDLLVLVRRILAARDPAALSELDAGLLEATRGASELDAWLARPLARPAPRDPLDTAVDALAAAAACVDALPPNSPRTATILGAAANLAKTVENIGKGRPRVDTHDEATARLVAVATKAVERIGIITGEEALDFEREREAYETWALDTLGPHIGAEVKRRLGVVLEGAPS